MLRRSNKIWRSNVRKSSPKDTARRPKKSKNTYGKTWRSFTKSGTRKSKTTKKKLKK